MIHRATSIKWLMVLGPVLFVALFVYAAYFTLPALIPIPAVYILVDLGVALAVFLLAQFVLRIYADRERETRLHERELAALDQVAEAVTYSLEPAEMLSRALDSILQLTHTAAGRIWLIDPPSGQINNTVHRGLFPEAFADPQVATAGAGIVGRVASYGKPEHVPDLSHSPYAELNVFADRGFCEFVSLPLLSKQRVVGVMDIAARHHGELATMMGVLNLIGRELGLAIEHARLYEKARERQTGAESLYKVGMDLSSSLDISQVLNRVTARGRELLNVQASALCLWDEQKRWLVVGSQNGPSDAFESQVGLGRRVAQKIALLRVDATHSAHDCLTCNLIKRPYCQAHVEIPVRIGDQVIGCLCVSSATPRTFSERDIDLLTGLADQAAIAIENARAYDRAGNRATAMERERLAREMHDTLAQVLGFVNTKAQATRELMATGRTEQAREQLDQIVTLSQDLYADVREVILGLRTAISPDKTLVPALENYVQGYTKQSGIEAQVVVENGARELTFAPAVELQLIRIVQESLTNIRKHARAQHATVRFAVVDGRSEMRIEDDGRGFDPARIARGDWPQFGLQTMRERAESVGGEFLVVSKPGSGTQIIVEIPLGYSGGR